MLEKFRQIFGDTQDDEVWLEFLKMAMNIEQ